MLAMLFLKMDDKIEDVNRILEIMQSSPSYPSLVECWKAFSRYLDISEVYIGDLEEKRNKDMVKRNDVLYEILNFWKASKGNGATLKVLHDALVRCYVDVAATLLEKAWIPKFVWQENDDDSTTLESILDEITSQKIRQKILQKFGTKVPTKPFQIIKTQMIPELPSYYIPRILSHPSTTAVDSKIFIDDSTKTHVFAITGIKHYELAKLTDCKRRADIMDMSQGYVHLEDLDMDYIILPGKGYGHFKMICKTAEKKKKTVHMIEHRNGQFFWVKSNKNVDVIKPFLKGEKKTISEQDMVPEIKALRAISIADSPGMGKTMVLANLARNLQAKFKDDENRPIVLFIRLQEFVGRIPHEYPNSLSVPEALAEYSAFDDVAKLVLIEILKDTSRQLYLFLDGYDEVAQEKRVLVDSFLEDLHKRKGNICDVNVIVTSRPHHKRDLELIFNLFAYEIHPFNETNQVDFLQSYWVKNYDATENDTLKDFAVQCVELTSVFTDKEKEIAGIPLQCMMLAEVYGNQAKSTALDMPTLPKNSVRPFSFFEMYKQLIKHQFGGNNPKRSILNAHYHSAFRLLFPEWSELFKHILPGCDKVEKVELYSVGLLEKGSDVKEARFVHRTFAEYLLAEFIAKNLGEHSACVDLLFGEILGKKGTTVKPGSCQDQYELLYPVISQFIDLQLKDLHNICSPPKRPKSERFSIEDVCVAFRACCTNDLENIFDYATTILPYQTIGDELRCKYVETLPVLVAQSSEKMTLLNKVMNFADLKPETSFRKHLHKEWELSRYLKISPYTPFHVAVYEGKHRFFMRFMKDYGEQANNLKFMLHVCVFRSGEDPENVIAQKKTIIDELLKLNRGWLKEVDEDNRTPLMQWNVHLDLLKYLVDYHGADINEYSKKHGTILHMARDENTYTDLVRWTFSNGFLLFRQKSSSSYNERTPLIEAIKRFGTVEDEVLRLYYEKGGEDVFNDKNIKGNSVLFFALSNSKSVDFIRKLIEYGAKVDHKNEKKINSAHKAIKDGKWESQQLLMVLELLEEKGFCQFNETYKSGETLLDLAQKMRKWDNDVLKFLKAKARDNRFR